MGLNQATAVCLAAGFLMAGSSAGENWAQWRGPFLNGSTTEANLPAKFTTTENTVWTAALPGGGGATPIVWEDRVFVSSQDGSRKTWAVCLSRADGKELWRHPIGSGFGNKQGNTAASPSPITDGSHAWFFYGTGDFVAFAIDGRQVWRRNIQKDHGRFEILWDYGATPLLHNGKLYVAVIHGSHKTGNGGRAKGRSQGPGNAGSGGGKSYLLCVDPATGTDVWKQPRPSAAQFESKQAYTTPIAMQGSAGPQLLVLGADHVTAHDRASGRELWRSPSYNPRGQKFYRTIVSPVVAGDMVLLAAPRGGSIYAIEAGRRSWAWTRKENSPDVCTPLAYRGRFYVLDGLRRLLLCLDPRSGKELGQCSLGGTQKFQASPTGADGKIYCINMAGEVVVLSAETTPTVLHRAPMGGKGCRASIAAAQGQLFVRADDTLYCVATRR